MSNFIFTCPQCGRTMEAQDEWIGIEAQCPLCGQNIIIAKPEQPPAPAVPLVQATRVEEKPCPFCGEMIKKEAVFCKHCKKELTGTPGVAGRSEEEKTFPYICPDCETFVELPLAMEGQEYECKVCAESHVATPATERKCPYCHEVIKIRANMCKYCRKQVPPLTSGAARKSAVGSVSGSSRTADPDVPADPESWGISEPYARSTWILFLCCMGWTGVLLLLQSMHVFALLKGNVSSEVAKIIFTLQDLSRGPSFLFTIASFVLFYRYWELIPRAEAETTPLKAVLFLLIPLYNLYWVFFITWKFSVHYREIDNTDSGSPLIRFPLTTVWFFMIATVAMAVLWGYIISITASDNSLSVGTKFGIFVLLMLVFEILFVWWEWRIQRCVNTLPRIG